MTAPYVSHHPLHATSKPALRHVFPSAASCFPSPISLLHELQAMPYHLPHMTHAAFLPPCFINGSRHPMRADSSIMKLPSQTPTMPLLHSPCIISHLLSIIIINLHPSPCYNTEPSPMKTQRISPPCSPGAIHPQKPFRARIPNKITALLSFLHQTRPPSSFSHRLTSMSGRAPSSRHESAAYQCSKPSSAMNHSLARKTTQISPRAAFILHGRDPAPCPSSCRQIPAMLHFLCISLFLNHSSHQAPSTAATPLNLSLQPSPCRPLACAASRAPCLAALCRIA